MMFEEALRATAESIESTQLREENEGTSCTACCCWHPPGLSCMHAMYTAVHQNSNLNLRKPDHLDYHRDGITSAKTCVDAHPSKAAAAARMYRRRLWTKGSRRAPCTHP
jgi:hypothetical protein